MGITIRKTEHDEYRVNYLGGTEATAYYTPHLDDAVQTGTAMAAEMRRNPSYKKYSGREGSAEFRPMLLEEAKMLHYGQHIWMLARDGSAVRVKVNGTPKRWKREPDRIEVPVKYGLYEYLTLTTRDFGPDGVALVEI
jgi:hypothetical protein